MKNLKNDNYQQGCEKELNLYNKILLLMISSGEIEIRRVRLKKFHKHGLIGESANSVALLEQNFEYIAVVDFEATCEEIRQANYSHEIIEFPIVLIDVQQQAIVNYFNQLNHLTILCILD